MSDGLMFASGLESLTADLSELTTGTPSITIRGPAPAVSEFTPLIRIMGAAPKIPLGVVIDTPGARPASCDSKEGATKFSIDLESMEVTEPVISLLS